MFRQMLAAKQKERQKVKDEIRSIVDEFQGKEVPAAKKEELRAKETSFDELEAEIRTLEKLIAEAERSNPSQGTTPPAGEDDTKRAIQQERERVSEITSLCRDHDIEADEFIKNGTSVDVVRSAVLEKLKAQRMVGGGGLRVEKDEADKIREAASDALLLRAGKYIEKPADGAREMRGLTLRDLAVECATRSGVRNANRLDVDDLLREVVTPNSQFVSIVSNSVNKSIATAYRASQATYQQWTRKGSVSNFKPATHYQLSEAGSLKKMTQSGEFKFDEMQDNGVVKGISTYGARFGLTRKSLIDDDLGILTTIPEKYVNAAKADINRAVYAVLGNNAAIYDGVALFHANHGNLGTAGVISSTTLSEGRKQMRLQKNLRGKETLNISPTFLIVPAALETNAQKMLESMADPSSNNSGVTNVFKNSLKLVVDAELDTYSSTSYYLAADPGMLDTIEVTFLNGDDMPKLESREGFSFLGVEFRIFIDYGINVLDYRGFQKNAGA